jgi:hypothetical protein
METMEEERVRRTTEKKVRMGQVYLEEQEEVYVFVAKNFLVVKWRFLQGFFDFLWCLRMVNRGEVVVECVVNVVG